MTPFVYFYRLTIGYLLHRLMRCDWMLLAIVMTLSGIGLIAMYSAGIATPGRFDSQVRNAIVAFMALGVTALTPVRFYKKIAVPLFVVGVILLILTLAIGVTTKGATRWLNIGIQIQPSEIMKLATPLMLAWFYQQWDDHSRHIQHFIAMGIMMVPVALILKQPDLGTSILVGTASFAVIYFAGLPKKFLAIGTGLVFAALPLVWMFGLHDYQRQRVLTLIDPTQDPLGKGFHTLQAMIAIGSGGLTGKGWMEGTQAQLDFIPERTSDFIFAVFSEEFGFIGNLVIIVLYAFLIGRSFYIATHAPNRFARLMACSIGVVFFTYSFVNMGMVSGILPVVGVPLPFISYGGTAFLILGISTGILLSIAAESRLSFQRSSL